MKKAVCKIAIIGILLPVVSIAQNSETDQRLIKAAYMLSVQSNRLSIIRNNLLDISKKNAALDKGKSPAKLQIKLLIENIFLIETICAYESLLLGTIEVMEGEKKIEQYQRHFSRLDTNTLIRLYQNFKSTQTNFARIDVKEINVLSDQVKKESLKVLRIVEATKNTLKRHVASTP